LVITEPSTVQAVQAFANEFVQRAEFIAAYPSTFTPEQFVDKLCQTAGLNTDANAAQCAQWVSDLHNGKNRAQVLREAIEDSDFKTREYNPAFVMMQYFGDLRRGPDRAGYNFWLNVLNNGDTDNYRGMVCSFITSREYQERFGLLLRRSNTDCAE